MKGKLHEVSQSLALRAAVLNAGQSVKRRFAARANEVRWRPRISLALQAQPIRPRSSSDRVCAEIVEGESIASRSSQAIILARSHDPDSVELEIAATPKGTISDRADKGAI